MGRSVSWSLPLAGDLEPLHGDGFVLVGDAAGLVDPFWGHGIDSAMVSGKLAATAVADALLGRVPMEHALQSYTDAVREHFSAMWQTSRTLQTQVGTLNALLGGTPLEHIQRSLGARDAAVVPLPGVREPAAHGAPASVVTSLDAAGGERRG